MDRNSQVSIAKALTNRIVSGARMHRAHPVLAILLTALTVSCSSILPGADAQNTLAPAGPPPVDYRKLIRAGIPSTVTDGAQVSELHKAIAPQPFDWVACLKLETKPNVSFIAVFFEGEKVAYFRSSVVIDRCELADYSPLTPPTPPALGKKTQPKHTIGNRRPNAPSPGLVPTPEERATCMPDVEKFCAGVTSVDQAFACLQANRSQISMACNQVLASHSQ